MTENKLINADSFEHLKTVADNSVDHIITDPPYDISFMNKKWDKDSVVSNPAFWKECLRVLKPGGYLLAFGHSRTSHRQTAAIEDAGFDIRDTIMWLYGSGFPKSHNVGKAVDASIKTGKSNPKALREIEQASAGKPYKLKGKNNGILGETVVWDRKEYNCENEWAGWGTALKPAYEPVVMARKPLEGTVADNVLEYGTGALNIDACRVGEDEVTINRWTDGSKPFGNGSGHPYKTVSVAGRWPANVILDEASGNVLDSQMQGASRFFYSPKVSKKERGATNSHPTVKPMALMEYLIKLVSKEGQLILDPFAGSGSTGVACVNLNRKYILIERDDGYYEIMQSRLAATLQDEV